jgi:hypothetical protein
MRALEKRGDNSGNNNTDGNRPTKSAGQPEMYSLDGNDYRRYQTDHRTGIGT